MKKGFVAITESGCIVYGEFVNVSDTMTETVRYFKENGYKAFKVEGMKKFMYI